MKQISERVCRFFLIFVSFFLLFGASPALADQGQFFPRSGEISSLGPKYLEFEVPTGVDKDSIKVNIVASNNRSVPIRNVEILGNTYKIQTPMLPPGRINWSWEYRVNEEIVRQNSWFVVDVDWQLEKSSTIEVEQDEAIGENNNKLLFLLVPVLVLGIFLVVILRRKFTQRKSLLLLLIMVLLLNNNSFSFESKAVASEKALDGVTAFKTPMACMETPPEIGLARCLRLWSLQAASEEPSKAVDLLREYGQRYKEDRNGMCEILEEYLYSAIAFTKGNEMAFSLVGKKSCGYQGADIRGIYIASASFIENDSFQDSVQDITKTCVNTVNSIREIAGGTLCGYPLPWITVRYSNGDLPAALKLCLEQDVFIPYSRCVFWSIGVFVRLISAYTYNGGTLIEERFIPRITPENKMLFCQDLELNIQSLCFAQASNSTGHTLQDLINYQEETCSKVQDESAGDCYAGVGYHLGNFTEMLYKDTLKVCSSQPKKWQRGCYVWSIAGRSAHHGAVAADLIQDVPLELRKNIDNDIAQIRKNI